MVCEEEQAVYVMPGIRFGFPVKFYPDGIDDNSPHFGFAAKVYGRSIDVMVPMGTNRSGVRHITDPRLAESEELRRDCGAWDYTDETKAMQRMSKEIEALTQRLDNLERAGRKKAE